MSISSLKNFFLQLQLTFSGKQVIQADADTPEDEVKELQDMETAYLKAGGDKAQLLQGED